MVLVSKMANFVTFTTLSNDNIVKIALIDAYTSDFYVKKAKRDSRSGRFLAMPGVGDRRDKKIGEPKKCHDKREGVPDKFIEGPG